MINQLIIQTLYFKRFSMLFKTKLIHKLIKRFWQNHFNTHSKLEQIFGGKVSFLIQFYLKTEAWLFFDFFKATWVRLFEFGLGSARLCKFINCSYYNHSTLWSLPVRQKGSVLEFTWSRGKFERPLNSRVSTKFKTQHVSCRPNKTRR